MNWRENPTRVAWLVLLASFFACCVLAVAVPLGARSYLLHATRTQTAFVTATSGTAQLWAPDADAPTAVTQRRPGAVATTAAPERQPVTEGSRVATDDKATALLTLAGDEAGERVDATVQLSPDTTIALQQARTPRFQWSYDPHRVALDFQKGRIYLTAQKMDERDLQVHVTTPQADLAFGQGTFDVLVGSDETQVRVRSGSGQVLAQGREVTVNGGERVTVATDRPPDLPVPDTLNLVLNGRFDGRLTPPWQDYVNLSQPDLTPGKVAQEQVGQRDVVRFTRKTEDNAPNEVGLRQEINRDVQGYDSLVLRFDLQLLNQSVPGGGYQASEYPVMARIDYTDIYGKDLYWVQGFYYLDLPSGVTWVSPTTRGEQVPSGVWYTYESPNLFQLLQDTRPARINKITIYAAGHDYDSRVADLALTVR
jgi:hypothetical protein